MILVELCLLALTIGTAIAAANHVEKRIRYENKKW